MNLNKIALLLSVIVISAFFFASCKSKKGVAKKPKSVESIVNNPAIDANADIKGIHLSGKEATVEGKLIAEPEIEEGVPVNKREFRGAWLSTIWQSRYRKMNSTQMKEYFIKSLDDLQAMGINAIIFQVRPQADAFYKSKYEPWSSHLSGVQGKAPDNGFDPLKFMIEECHKRNMELHAWINPYRVTSTKGERLFTDHIYNRYPNRFFRYDGKIYFNPGVPENREFIAKVVKDIVLNYDVDAIHMDDYFYPYPIPGRRIPDTKTYEKYRKKADGFTKVDITDWRRENVNLLVRDIKEAIMETKPWVRFGVSPFGIYRNKRSTPDGSGSETTGLQGYSDLYADVKYWAEQNWIDYNMPQLYWEMGHKAADYEELIRWWNENAHGQHLYVGQDVKRTMDVGELDDKINMATQMENVGGNAFWPAYELLDNYNGIATNLIDSHHKYPALIPAYTNMYKGHPHKVNELKEEYTASSHTLSWTSNHDPKDPVTAQYYVVYRFAKGHKKNIEDARKIVEITRKTQLVLPYEGAKNEYTYIVTAVDAFHNESQPREIKIKL